MNINFFYEEIDEFSFEEKKCISWINLCIEIYKKKAGNINIIFTNDEYLLNINKQYLQHDYYTDIITFDYCEADIISGDIYISLDRVKENAQEFNQEFDVELHRVIIHGILHLIGYNDHSDEEKKIMRLKEGDCLKQIL